MADLCLSDSLAEKALILILDRANQAVVTQARSANDLAPYKQQPGGSHMLWSHASEATQGLSAERLSQLRDLLPFMTPH
jgi:hypothetical protein